MRMSAENDEDSFPRSMRHRQVLDVAAEHPDASVSEIASMVPSATADLVEHVFEEHGDPAAEPEEAAPSGSTENESGEPTDGSESTATEAAPEPEATADRPAAESEGDADRESAPPDTADPSLSVDELTETQRELLEVVADRPDATQAEIADHFDVTRATVSRWATEIDGFDWRDRAEVIDDAVEVARTAVSTDGGSAASKAAERTEDTGPADGDGPALESRLERLESRIGELEAADGGVADVELAHKIAHACLESDAISEDEELRILEWLLE